MFIKQDYGKFFCHHPVLTDEYYRGKPLEIGLGPQLVMGDVIVEDQYLVKQMQERPQLFSEKPLLEAEYPWELYNKYGLMPMTYIYDEEDDVFKLWYTALGYHENDQYDTFKNIPRGDYMCLLCYAESKDGFNWTKPLTDENPIGRNRLTNVVFTGSECGFGGGRILLNPRRKENPEQKYLFSYNSGDGIRIAFSPDGRHWADIPGINPVIPVSYDTHVHMIYDDERGVYQIITRPSVFAKPESSPNGPDDINLVFRRRVCITESSDLIHWSTVRLALHAPETAKDDQCDNQSTFAVGATLIGRLDRFTVEPEVQMMHPYWVTGPSLYDMHFIFDNEPIPHVRMRSYASTVADIRGYPMYTDDNKMVFIAHYSAYNKHTGSSRLAVNYVFFGENRLVSRSADAFGGWLLTREFIMRGTKIEVNCDVQNGSLTAEIITGENGCVRGGMYHEGFTVEDCDPVTEDSYHKLLTWHGSSDLSCFKDKAIHIRFHINNAKLYSFSVLE